MEHDGDQIINELLVNQEMITQHNAAIQLLYNESIQLRKEYLEKVLLFEYSARNQVRIINILIQDDKYNQLLKENEFLKGLNIQIKNDSEAALRQDVINTKNLLQKLQVKQDELIQLRQSQTTLLETLQDIQNHDEIQMLELEKSQRSFNDLQNHKEIQMLELEKSQRSFNDLQNHDKIQMLELEKSKRSLYDLQRTNQELLQKLNDQSSSQSYFNNSFEILELQNSKKDIQVYQLNQELLVKEADIYILNNQIQKLDLDRQENITLKVQINSQQKLNEIQVIELEKLKQSFNNQEEIYQVQKLNAECCQAEIDKNIQILQCFNNQLNNDHLIQKNENSILKDKINQMNQLNQQIIASLQQIEMDPSFRSQGQYELDCEIQQYKAPIPPNIIVGPDDSLLSFQFLSSKQVIAPPQQIEMDPPFERQQVELNSESIVITVTDVEDDIIFEIPQQQVPLRPTKKPRKQNRIIITMYVKVVKKIKPNSLD